MWFIFSSIPQVNCLLCFTLWCTILNLSISSLSVFSFLICLPRNHCATHWSSSPKFSFRSCKLFPVFTFRFYLVWVDFFKYGIRERSNLIKFCISMLVFTRPFVEKTIFFFLKWSWHPWKVIWPHIRRFISGFFILLIFMPMLLGILLLL